MNQYVIIWTFAFFLGLAIGSFMNVCIYRLPLGKSIIWPPSHCPKCGEKIKFYDNIPILSYIILRGKCRYCNVPVSLQYPLVELITGILSLALFIRYGPTYQYLLYFLFTSVLLIISFIDFHHKIIPDVLSLPSILIGIAVSFGLIDIKWSDSLIGLLAGGASLYLVGIVYEFLTGREGLGGGDVKLLAMIGAWMGWRALPMIVLMASLAGILAALVFLIYTRKGLRTRIPFGPFLSLGAVMYLFFGNELTRWYIGLLKF
jgi:leader peptidase (prepilin peptidase)/N-methyltransferase